MSISYNYFFPTSIYGTLRVLDLGFPGFTAVNANIYCQRNINCDGQLQCAQFHSLGTSYFDQVPTCITNATTSTQLTNLATVQALLSSSGITLQQAIDGVHTSILPFTAIQTINNNLIITNPTTTTSRTTISQNSTTGQCIFTNQGNTAGAFLFIGYNGATAINLLSISSTLCSITSTQINLNSINANSFACVTTATFNGNFPTTTLGNNLGVNNNEFATVGYVKSIGGTSILSLNNTFTGTNTFNIPIVSSGASITANTIPALSIVNSSINQTQIATGFLLISTLAQNITGIKTFLSPIVSSGASLTANTIPALSLVNNSLTNSQVATGFQFVSTSAQTFSGIKTFSSAIVSSGESLTANTIPALSIVNNSITNSQIASGFQLVTTNGQTFSGNKIFNGTGTINEMIINIPSTFVNYNGSIGFIPACSANYLNLTTSLFDSMMYIGQPIANGINQPYGFTIGDYNSGLTGIRISGTGASGNCSIGLNGQVRVDQLLTLEGGLFCDGGNITTPNNAVLGNIFSDIINNYDQNTGTDISINPNNFVTCLVNAGNSSILPTGPIGFGGLKIGWNCSNSFGESDFINLANYTSTGGFNFYTMNASSLPSLIGSLRPSALTINGGLVNNSISNSSTTTPYLIKTGTMPLPTTTSTMAGMGIGWNAINGGGLGECDLINYGQGGAGGGFNFSTITSTQTNRNIATLGLYGNYGLWLYSNAGRLRIDDRNGGAFWWSQIEEGSQMQMSNNGISTSITLGCGNASGVGSTCITVNTTAVTITPPLNTSSTITSTGIISAPSFNATNSLGTSNLWGLQTGNANISGTLSTANIIAQGLTTFNTNHPTTSLGNNISTNTTQYATVGYVNAVIPVIPVSLLGTNNTWTGTNTYSNTVTFNYSTFLAVGPILNTNLNISLVAPLLQYYNYTAGAAYSISIPSATLFKGLKIIFRRYQTNVSAVTLACPTGLIVAPNSITSATTYIMAVGNFKTEIISDGTSWQGL